VVNGQGREYDEFMRGYVVLVLAALALVATPAVAQVKIETRPTPRQAPEIVPPGLHYDQTRPPDANYYAEPPRVEHDPAFIEPFTSDYETPTSSGTVGLSGWTSPATPVGPTSTAYREVPGWLAIGLTFTWGGPPPTRRPAPVR
jgi:hypothetical protein